ncbi:hypothetical protein BH09VER1_BH09VER1_40370 [soil metagenome]
MEDSEHNLRLEIAKVLDSRNENIGREMVRRNTREMDVVQDGHFYHLAVNDRGQLTITEPEPKKVFGKILLGLACFALLGVFALILADYVNLKLAGSNVAAHPAPPPPEVLGSTERTTAALLAPLPAAYEAPRPEPPATAAAPAPVATAVAPATAGPTPGNRQIPLSRGFGEVKEDDGSTKFLIKPTGD